MTTPCRCRQTSPIVLNASLPPLGAEQTVADVAHHRPWALEIMRTMGIDHCCGAHLTLREAAAAAGTPLPTLLAALDEPGRAPA